jgi:hypothetical protein
MIKQDLIKFIVDKKPAKHSKFLPGSHIPIKTENHFLKFKPDYVVILPWNLKKEIATQLDYIKRW